MTISTDSIFHRVITNNWPQISHGKDCYLYAEDGRAYLDACAGVHVVSIGHGVPEISAAMQSQADKVCFTYARFLTQPQIDLADKLTAMAPGDLNRVFFVSGGSEATEAGLKIARKYPSFPIVLETYREVMQEHFDLPALTELLTDIRARRVRVTEVALDAPSPFASSLTFDFIAAYIYEVDAPPAERRAAARDRIKH